MSITPITRSEVIRRAATIWPVGHVQYSMHAVRNPGWRTDCSGYVSMCLNLVSAKPGASTVTLVKPHGAGMPLGQGTIHSRICVFSWA
jgi:hypothetical protein